MASLRDIITNLLRRNRQQAGEVPVAQTTAQPLPPRIGELSARFKAETTRADTVIKCREMYDTDPRAKKMIKTIARDLMKGGYVVKTDDQQALTSAEDLRKRLNLDQRLDDWIRRAARDGDAFLEASVDRSRQIVMVTAKPTLQMHRESDEYDQFPDPTRAYWYADKWQSFGGPPKDALWFAEWQIVHARWDHDEGKKYGTPMMSSGVGHWKKVTEGELDMAVRRKTRAGQKYNHQFPEGTDAATILAYKELNKDVLDDPFAAIQDFFGTPEIKVVEGDAHLSEIADVLHQISTWFASSDIPMELIAYGENLNRDVLQEKRAEYNETLVQLREWVTAELIQPLIELQWLLDGIYPPNVEYSIEWRAKKEPTPQDVQAIAAAAAQFRLIGIPDNVIGMIISHFLPGIEPDELFPDAVDGQDAGASRIDQVLRNAVNRISGTNGNGQPQPAGNDGGQAVQT
jgi:hypothetical protein